MSSNPALSCRPPTALFHVIGVESSPYTAKIRAWFRYRHIPHIWECRFPQLDREFAERRPRLMPVVRYPDGVDHDDSSRIILDLENLWPGYRSVRPDDPVLDLYSLIIEDMSDELLTKLVYKYRFQTDVDRRFASQWVMDDTYPALGLPELQEKAAAFLQRQDERGALVGINTTSHAMLDQLFDRLVAALMPMVARDVFLFGSRPSLGDFGIFAQLSTLCVDPSPSRLIRERAPRIEYWVRRMHDLSGVNGVWQTNSEPSATVVELLRMAGTFYLPMLAANSKAMRSGALSYEIVIDGQALTQKTFPYHNKCLAALQKGFVSLSSKDRTQAAGDLDAAGCLQYLETSSDVN